MHDLGLLPLLLLGLPLDGPDAAYMLFKFFLGMTIRLVSRPGGLTQVVEVALLMWHPGQGPGDGLAEAVFPIRDHAGDRHG